MQQANIDRIQQAWLEVQAVQPCLHVGCGEKPIPWAENIDPNPSRAKWRDHDYDVCDLPYPDGTFKTVVSSHVLPAIDDLDKAMAEMIRVLQPDGTMAHVIPDWRYAPQRQIERYPWQFQRQGWNGPGQFGLYVARFVPQIEIVTLESFPEFNWSFRFVARKVTNFRWLSMSEYDPIGDLKRVQDETLS
jgi:SAM-dependent methyltransferase